MTTPRSLEPFAREPARLEAAALEAQVALRETELAAVKTALQQLQSDYFNEVGALYSTLNQLQSDLADVEIRLGLRPPPGDDDENDEEAEAAGDAVPGEQDATPRPGCSNRAAASENLKRVFRDLAKAIHPDRAPRHDEPARFRRHSLMAEANRAYAERDEDRLRLILRTWERSPESVIGDDPDAGRIRVDRRLSELRDRLLAIDVEFADLRASAIWRLKAKIDDARARGWDLFAEIVMEVKREIARASARLAKLDRQRPV